MDDRGVAIRTDLRPGDLGRVVTFHGETYAREHGFDGTFEAYVAGPLAELALKGSPRERLWQAERDGRLVGCAGIVEAEPDVAQFRWFLVDPSCRGVGLGRRLLEETLRFARQQGYRRVILWTVSELRAAARAYRAAGFVKVEERPGRHWSVDVVEEKHELEL